MNTKQIIINKALRGCRLLELSILLCLLFLPASLHAERLVEQEVRAAVQTWVRYVTADADPNAVIEEMEPYIVDAETVGYIAHLGGGGFCLCGADDLVLPVYLYNPKERYYEEHPGYQYVLWEISTRSEYFRKALKDKAPGVQAYQAALSQRAVYWQELIGGRAPERMQGQEVTLGEPSTMELNLTTRWHQRAPYNNDRCPTGDTGCTDCCPGEPWICPPSDPTLVGCVATAMAQIMKYWDWPSSGTGSHSYTWDGDDSCDGPVGGGTLSATFSDAYDWANMANAYITDGLGGWENEDGNTLTQANVDAVAELCYEAGVSVEMDYGVCGSGAWVCHPDHPDGRDVVDALEKQFRYDHDATCKDRGSDMIDTMTSEIQWLRPIEFGGYREEAPLRRGHAFIIYGYSKENDPDRQFLMNMGWGPGSSAEWYTCDSVDYKFGQKYVIQIAPLNVVKFVGEDNPGYDDGSPSNPYRYIDQAIAEAPDGATLIFKAGSVNIFSSSPLVIDRPFTLKGYNVVIQ
jgi:hypothetical protein